MTKRTTIVNNGFPAGLSREAITVGDVVSVHFDDSEPILALIVTDDDYDRPVNYKGLMSFTVLDGGGIEHRIQSDQIQRIERKYALAKLLDGVIYGA